MKKHAVLSAALLASLLMLLVPAPRLRLAEPLPFPSPPPAPADAATSSLPLPPATDTTGSVAGMDPARPAALAPGTERPAPTAALLPGPGLGATPDWGQPTPEAGFREFKQWSARYLAAATPEEKAALEREGVMLARARTVALADLIQSNPERALQLTVPEALRQALPGSVTALLEQRVTTTGDFQVLGVRQLPDRERDPERSLPPVLRAAIIGEETYEVFTYGRGLTYVTRRDVPLNGIAVDVSSAVHPPRHGLLQPTWLLALDPSPARLLGGTGRDRAVQGEPVCSVSGLATEVAVQLGTRLKSFCGRVHAEEWANAGIAGAGLDAPSGDPGALPVAASSYTEGRKRMLLLRPVWSDYTGGMTTNDALTHFQNFSNYMYEMSYGKLVLAPLGKGSEVTPPMVLPGLVAEYDNTGLGKLYTMARGAAQTNFGYDLTKFDFTYVCTGSRPAADYAGLAFVGGVGLHLANGYWDAATACHEFGHNLGLNHAHLWDTTARSIIGPGVNDEYGDHNDPMGSGGTPNSYNSRYKNYLGWIPDADVADVSLAGGGSFRVYAFDLDNSSGLRGLKFRRNASQNYWVQFRQRKVGNKALMNGVQLLWTGNGNEGSYLLDLRLKGNSDNNALVIGRTFSDTNIQLHVTPVRLGHTYPESIDVEVRVGSFPGNQAPAVTVSADTLAPAASQPVSLTAAASDPDGDVLAYFWEFGDGDYSVENSPFTTHVFTAAGEYRVQCTVSDMKGKSAVHSQVVRVGTPATFRISGRILDPQNRPVPGMKVSTDTGRSALTDSDGSYTITGLAAGNYGIDASDPVAAGFTFIHPGFNNPVTVGPSVGDKDLVGLPGNLSVGLPLVARGSAAWRYLDTGSDQGTGWRGTGFNDGSWASGAAPLGYPAGAPITTVLGFGPSATAKYPTYYFRRSFTVNDPAAFTDLQLDVLRDDGVIVYVNGTEAYRNNMPAGAVTFATTSSTRVDAGTYLQASIGRSLLVPGNNVIAAEVHQFDGASSDITFDAALTGISLSNVTGIKLVYVSSPADRARLVAPADVTLAANAFTSGATVSLVEFFVDGAKVGQSAAAPFTTSWSSPAPGSHLLSAVASLLASGSVTSPPVTVEIVPPATPSVRITNLLEGAEFSLPASVAVGAKVDAAGQLIRAVQFFVDGQLVTEDTTAPYAATLNLVQPGPHAILAAVQTTVGGSYPGAAVNIVLAPPSAGVQLVSFGESWAYLDDGTALHHDWVAPGFNDREWNIGPGRLGYGADGELTTVSTGPPGGRNVTTYFRKRFEVGDPTQFGRLLLRLQRDDGAVVYLNGVEVARDNLLPGAVSFNSLAVAAIEGALETVPVDFTLNATLLRPGTNVLAVEVHQVAIASSDLGFDLALIGLGPVAPSASFYLTQPSEGARFLSGSRILLSGYSDPSLTPAGVTYFADGTALGSGSNTSSFPFPWTNVPIGQHTLVGLVDYGAGVLVTSTPVHISVVDRPPTVQPVATTLLSAGASWRYWDSATPVGGGWARTDFNDTTWLNGAARFGWGLDGEKTTLTDGRVTAYFRRWIVFPTPGVISDLDFLLARDDGAVVYLNGHELFRSNMPGGDVTPSTLALGSVNPPEETIYYQTVISTTGSGFVGGSNLLAVELHQSSAASSDAGFDLQLILRGTTEPRVYLTSPVQGAGFTGAGVTIPIEAIARGVSGAAVTNVEFFADGEKLGEVMTAPWRIVWTNPTIGQHVLTARSWDVSGFVVDSMELAVSVGRTPVTTVMVPTNAVWRYQVTGSNLETSWTAPAFNEAAWPAGAARLGFGGDGEVTLLGFGGNAANKYVTTYFRKSFTVTDGAVYTNLTFKLLRDDGAVVWLNGQELFRSNMPATPINYQTLASAGVSGADEQTFFVTSLGVTNLAPGTNVLAVEIHQATVDSSDLGFNLELTASGYLEEIAPPRLSVVYADGFVEVSWPNTSVGYRVYEAPSLSTPVGAWTASAGSLVQVGGRFVYTLPASASPRFYRLGKP